MEGRGRGVDSFCSLKLPYLKRQSLNNFVADFSLKQGCIVEHCDKFLSNQPNLRN